jgi:hypothetical protein
LFFLGFRRRQASPVFFSDHQASPWSSRNLLAHQVSPVTISASSRTESALQAPPVTISASPRITSHDHLVLCLRFRRRQDSPVPISITRLRRWSSWTYIGSPGFAGDHLGLISAHRASPVTISAPRAPPRLAVTLSAFLCTTGLTPVALDSRSTALGYSQACLGPRLGSLTSLQAPTSLGSSRTHSEHLTPGF